MVLLSKLFWQQASDANRNKALTYFIVSLCACLCAACGVRGPLTVNPKPIKGVETSALQTPADLRANPATSVLFGGNGTQTIIPAPEAK
jgi:hypothetical protein